MRHRALISLLIFTVTFSAGCATSRSGSKFALALRRDTAKELKQLTDGSEETDAERESSSEVVQASFTTEADGDSAALSMDSSEESEEPQWWTATETKPELENPFSTETTLSANSATTVTTNKQTGSWKPTPKRGWTATKPR